MFLRFYGLKEQPFGVTPDPRFLYLSPSHREALASLYCSIENNRGFSAMVAPPGMGKTSLLFRLLRSLKEKARTAFLFHPDYDAPQFMQSLMLDIGLDGSGNDFVKMRDTLNRLLIEERRAGRRFVLVVDEAQNLSSEILESIRLLSNFETPEEKLIHIVLAGQPRLAETLERPEMCQLSQRVSTLIGLHPFSLQETAEYIRYRLGVAGRRGPSPFSKEAVSVIAQESHGIPRNINSLCFQALSIGCALRKSTIDGDVLRELTLDLRANVQRTISLEQGVYSAESWRHTPLREEISTWNRRAESKSGTLRIVTAIAATAAFSGIFWTVALPKIKLYSDLNKSNQIPTQLAAPPAASPESQEQSLSEESAPVPPAAGEEANEQLDVAPKAISGDTVAAGPMTRKKSDEIGQTIGDSSGNSGNARNYTKRHGQPSPTGPRVVFTSKQESLFQVALDNYGESSPLIVDKILLANPRFQNRYAIVGEGQRIILPSLTETKASASSKSTSIKRD
jgi:type II secretory pathway predicted ATPase ExeA